MTGAQCYQGYTETVLNMPKLEMKVNIQTFQTWSGYVRGGGYPYITLFLGGGGGVTQKIAFEGVQDTLKG